jgi:serine protease AprX
MIRRSDSGKEVCRMSSTIPTTILSSLVTLGLIAVAGCAGRDRVEAPSGSVPTAQSAVLSESEDKFDLVFLDEWVEGKPVSVTVGATGKRYEEAPKTVKSDEGIKPRPLSRIHPLVEQWLSTKAADDMVEVIVSVKEYMKIPRFPEPDIAQSREEGINRKAIERSRELVDQLIDKRKEFNRTLNRYIADHQGKMIEEYWLVPAMRVAIPVKSIQSLLKNDAILYIEPVQTNDYPPANGNTNDDVDDARALIQSDAYFNQGLTSGWIGLLDSGVHRTHQLLASPSRIALWRDCTSGNANCTGGNPDDACWNHGTSAAAIISGNNNQGNPQRGVTGIQVDAWKVYPDSTDAAGNCNGGLNTTATINGFQQAVSWFDRVIVAEMQGSGNESSAIAQAADAAFDAGSAVIAANGNNGPNAGTVNVPAIAHKVIGVGGFDTESGTQYANQSRGPTGDNRFKPDIQTPNNSETASTGCAFGVPCTPLSDSANRVFGGTSGAVPYGGAAAALARNWMRRVGQVDPGHVYARLIVAGQTPYPFDNISGAGRIRLPINGFSWWGKVSVAHHETVEIPLNVTRESANNLDGAIWWPETAANHNDIDLRIVSPSGAVMDSSISIPSVFERVRAAGNVATGSWKLRIYGYSVSGGRQTIYYNATVRH